MKKILVFSDLKIILENETTLLSGRGSKVFSASSALELLKIHTAERVDLIIADLQMPGMRGDELSSIIRKDDVLKNVSLILVCPNKKPEVQRCENCGANFCLTKPLDTEDLSRKAEQLLNIAKRKILRVVMKVSVEGKFRGQIFSTTHNISASGVLLETDKTLARGDKIACSFFLDEYLINTDGEVVRIVEKAADLYHYGVRFLSIESNSKAQIERYVQSR